MGAGCSASAGIITGPQQADFPPRPAYLACDLVGPPIVEKVHVGPVDGLLGQASQFAEAICQLNDTLNGILLEVRLATGLLQGGFSVSISPSPNVDIFSVELLTAEGRPLEVAEAAQLRGRDLTRKGRITALDAHLARCVEQLTDFFISNVGSTTTSLALSKSGTLVPRTVGQPPDPVVEAFNRAMLDMRCALGADYLLALHLHKAQAHGVPAFRVRVLKPVAAPMPAAAAASPRGTAPARDVSQQLPGGAAATAAAAGLSGWEPASLLDQAACLHSSRLADALHSFHDANGRHSAALKAAELTCPNGVTLTSPRMVALAGTAAAAAASTSAPAPAAGVGARRYRNPAAAAKSPAAVAAAAVRSLPPPSLVQVARAVEGLNAAVHSLAHAAAAAPGPASFAALLTHVLGELRDLVASAGGERALESYQPSVAFSCGPDAAPIAFSLDTQLEGPRGGAAGGPGGGWGRHIPPFPECLSLPVRRAWLLLLKLLRLHNSTVGQLESLRQLAEAFEDGLRRRIATAAEDAAAARLPPKAAAEAARALLRNHLELRDCCQGALQALTATARLVKEEMAEAAQLATVQCGFMSPLAWSVSVASSAAAGPGGAGGSLTSQPLSGAAITAAASPSVSNSLSGPIASSSPHRSPGASHRVASAARGPPESPAAAGGGGGASRMPAPDSPPDVFLRPDQQPHSQSPLRLGAAGTGQTPGSLSKAASTVVSRMGSRSVAAAEDGAGVRTIRRSSTARPGSGESGAGWVPVGGQQQPEPDGGAEPAGSGQGGGGGPSPRRQLQGWQSQGARSRAGAASLAEEYARAALAHLRLQEL